MLTLLAQAGRNMADSNSPAPIIVKRVKGGGHGGHHGGAWKVAYADFVTAMMAFFLLLWLLNVTTEEQKNGIADYFTPSTASTEVASGAGGVLGGLTVTVPGSSVAENSPLAVADPVPTEGVSLEITQDEEEGSPEENENVDTQPNVETPPLNNEQNTQANTQPNTQPNTEPNTQPNTQPNTNPSEEAIDKAIEAREQKMFSEVAEELKQAIQKVPELADLQKSLIIDQTPEGLRIQIVDQEGYSMFQRGSAVPEGRTRTLLDLVAQAVTKLPNKLSISGHTDALQFANPNSNYSNWELSSDRANAARRQLSGGGIDPLRIATVVGRADKEPFIKDNPEDPRNRRLSIILLREKPLHSAPAPESPEGLVPAE
jgi:chemotaxis protein MotB